jgi:hypothetical protein
MFIFHSTYIYTCNIVSNILNLFNLNIDTDDNFHIRDVGSPNAFWTIPAEEKVVVDFNATWQPVGTSGMKFRRLGARYVRTGKFVGLSAPNWRKVDPQLKEDLWAALMVCKTSYKFIALNIYYDMYIVYNCFFINL